MGERSDFYEALPVFTGFAHVMDPELYQPLPEGWLIGLSDIVDSTGAIAAGRYKVVNTAGAAVIAALINALRGRAFPFVFGGDGASFAVGPDCAATAREALASTAAWVRDELGLELRTALVPVDVLRERGLDVRVARFAPSPNVSYAMFSGGGLALAEKAMKRGEFALPPGSAGSRPDLTGLSCRWEEIRAGHGVILSILLVPGEDGEHPRFRALIEEVLTLIETTGAVARPLQGLELRWMSGALDLEARSGRKAGQSLWAQRLRVFARATAAYAVFRLGRRVGRFDPAVYRRELVENSDFRKYDDGLRMTLDCTPDFALALEQRLERAQTEGIARYGLHRQATAVLTCITPSVFERDHVHFVDGAAGGYALAAKHLKQRSDAGPPPG